MSEIEQQPVVIPKRNGAPEFVGVAGAGTSLEVPVYTVSMARVLAIRVVRVWLQTFLGLLAIDGLGIAELAPPGEAFQQMLTVGGLALAPSVIALLQNLLEFLTRLDVKNPTLHA